MKTLLSTSFLILALTGGMLAKTANIPFTEPGDKESRKLVADIPMPDPNSKTVPKLVADIPMPDPNSKTVPKLVG